MKYRIPRELERLRDFLEAERPHKELTLEQSLTEDAAVLVNPIRALETQDFQGGAFMLLRALQAGRIKVARRHKTLQVADLGGIDEGLPTRTPLDPPVERPAEPA